MAKIATPPIERFMKKVDIQIGGRRRGCAECNRIRVRKAYQAKKGGQ